MSFFGDVCDEMREEGTLYDGAPRRVTDMEAQIFDMLICRELIAYNDAHAGGEDADYLKALIGIVRFALGQAAEHGFDFPAAWANRNRERLLAIYCHELEHPHESRKIWFEKQVQAAAKDRLRQERARKCPNCAEARIAELQRFEREVLALADNGEFFRTLWYRYNGDLQTALRERIAQLRETAAGGTPAPRRPSSRR